MVQIYVPEQCLIHVFFQTYNADRFVTGSAASAGAYLCGEKVRAGTIGVNQNVIRGRCDLVKGNEMTSILEHSHAAGK